MEEKKGVPFFIKMGHQMYQLCYEKQLVMILDLLEQRTYEATASYKSD